MATRPATTTSRNRRPRRPRPSELARRARQSAPTVADEAFTQSFDAQDWARAFVKRVKTNPRLAADEGAMIGWFANAIMRGYDEHARKLRVAAEPKRAEEGIIRASRVEVVKSTAVPDASALQTVNERVGAHAAQLGIIRERLYVLCDRLGLPHQSETQGAGAGPDKDGKPAGTIGEIGSGLELQLRELDSIRVLVTRLEKL